MGVDGFSMSSLGLPKEVTSAQAAAVTEQNIAINEKSVQKINESKNKRITDEEKEKENKKKKNDFNDGLIEEEKTDENSENQSENEEPIIYRYKLEEKADNVSIRFNAKNETVELFNKITENTIDSMHAQEFVDLVSNLDYNSGILINKNI